MKGYRKFLIAIGVLMLIYIIAETNRPKKLEWEVTMSKFDRGPFGAYVLYQLMSDFFSDVYLIPTREPILNTVEYVDDDETEKSAYILIEPNLNITKIERDALLRYANAGNYVFLAADNLGKLLNDTLKIKFSRRFNSVDSVKINFENPSLKTKTGFSYRPFTLDAYFSKLDSSSAVALGRNSDGDINFFSMPVGKGMIYVHANPLCFSNDFLLTGSNADYASAALSYLPKDIETVYWDEYYKVGPEGSSSPMRFILSNVWLRWSFRLGLLAILGVLFFESKRRQRIIPIVTPLKNSTLDFVRTVGNAYFNRRDHKNMALKKISHFTEFVRSKFYISTQPLDDNFITAFAAKSGRSEEEIHKLVGLINYVNDFPQIDETTLLALNRDIDSYYQEFGVESVT